MNPYIIVVLLLLVFQFLSTKFSETKYLIFSLIVVISLRLSLFYVFIRSLHLWFCLLYFHFILFSFYSYFNANFINLRFEKATLGRIGLWNKFGIENINGYVPISSFNTSSFIEIPNHFSRYLSKCIYYDRHMIMVLIIIYTSITLGLSNSDYYQWWFSA